jgi:hypothetical protein
MKACPTCSREYRGPEQFCSKDGTRLTETIPEPKEALNSGGPARAAPAHADHSRTETLVRELLDKRFREIDPKQRPWYGTGLEIFAGPKRSKVVPFLIVSPNQITAARIVEIEAMKEGAVHGDPNLKEWFLQTPDGKRHRLQISGASPFEDARQTLNFLLPNLDGFLHSRGIKNPFVHSLVVFPDAYSFDGVRDAATGPRARAAVSLVKASELPEAALFTPDAQKLDANAFQEWLKLIAGDRDNTIFKDTWLDLPFRDSAAPSAHGAVRAAEPVEEARLEIPPETGSKEWVMDEAADGPPLIDLEDETLLEQEKRYRSKQQLTPAGKGKRNIKTLAFTSFLAVIFAAAGLWFVYEFNRPITLPPYLEESSAPSTPENPPAREIRSPLNPPTPTDSAQRESSPENPPAKQDAEPQQAATRERPGKSAESKTPPEKVAQKAERPAPPAENSASTRATPAGTYETIRPTLALKQADASAPVVDRIGNGTRLNVTGSDGDWLIVHSRARNATVYVNRADAIPVSAKAAGKSGADIELKWKEIELQIQEAILKRGVPGITVSFMGDTAFLKGTVQSAQQSQAAELGARTIPDVAHVHNGIWVRP